MRTWPRQKAKKAVRLRARYWRCITAMIVVGVSLFWAVEEELVLYVCEVVCVGKICSDERTVIDEGKKRSGLIYLICAHFETHEAL